MDILIHRFRSLVALVCFAVLAALIGMPHLGLHLLVSRAKRETEDQCHRRLSQWFIGWCRVYNRCFWLLAGLRWKFVISDEDRALARSMPMLVTGNHYGTIDATLYAEGAARIGVPKARAVAMQEIRSWPVIGYVLSLAKTAFMRRQRVREGRNLDVEDLEAFGQSLHQDKSWAVIFVEGAVFQGTPDEGYQNVKRPKTRGIEAMLRGMPDHPLMIATSVWHDYDARKGMWLASVPPGSEVTIHCKVIRRPEPTTVPTWLPREWKQVDQTITDMR